MGKGLLFFIGAVLLVSCVSSPQLPITPSETSGKTPKAPEVTRASEWETIMAMAKKEGSLTLYTSIGPETRQILAEAFFQMYGIKMETAAFGASADLVAKVRAEQTGGIYFADAYLTGGTTISTGLKPHGLVRPLEPLVVLPEALDPNAWKGGKLPFLDKEKLILPLAGSTQRGIIRNTQMVSEDEITSVKDVLKPQYKGKIILGDARRGGAGSGFFGQLAFFNWNLEETAEYMRGLIKQEVVLTDNDQLAAESVARGKYSLGLGISSERISNLIKLGVPILPVAAKEGLRISSGSGTISLPVRSAHPNASVVFLNWVLTKEGMTTFGKGIQQATFRQDIVHDWISPVFLPQPGEQIFYDSEEFVAFRATAIRDLAREVFAGR